jgi:hypothetical protein
MYLATSHLSSGVGFFMPILREILEVGSLLYRVATEKLRRNYMKIISKNRGEGKTTELIKLSAETGYRIVVHDDHLVKIISEKAKEMNLEVPFPISKQQINLKQFSEETFLIDELELFVDSSNKIHAATINKENVVEEDIVDRYQRQIDALMNYYERTVKQGDLNIGLNILKNIDLLNRQIEQVKRCEQYKTA